MIDQLQSAFPSFRWRLAETIAWCTSQSLESNPFESASIKERRMLGEEAAKLSREAYLSKGTGFCKSALYRRAQRLFTKAKLHEIVPMHHQLRSSFLQPSPFVYPPSDEEKQQILVTLSEKRAERLRLKKRYPIDATTDPQAGRLLLYAPDENLCDGAAKYSSKGFFDVNNIPLWDIWVCFFRKYLVSWVPSELLQLANARIEVNSEQC